MTFTKSDVSEKLQDRRKQTRRLTRLSPKYEVGQILGEVVPIESGGLPEHTRTVSRRSEDLSPNVTV